MAPPFRLFLLALTSLLLASPDGVAQSVVPSVTCVEEVEDGGYRAYFGYLNEAEGPVTVPLGHDNRYQGGRTDDEPATDFAPGEHPYAFEASFPNRLTWSLRTGGVKRMVRADQRHPLFNACDPPEDNPEVEVGSPGALRLSGADPSGFNRAGLVSVTFALDGASFSPDALDHIVVMNDAYLAPVEVSPTAITFEVLLNAGRNDLALFSADDAQRALTAEHVLWAGTQSQTVRVVDEAGMPVDGALVTFAIVDDADVAMTGATAGGAVTFANVPPRTLIASAEDGQNRFGTAGALGNGAPVTVTLLGFAPPSPIDNNDFSLGTEGWDVTSGITDGTVTIIPHEEEVGPTGSAPLEKGASGGQGVASAAGGDSDLQIGTGGEGPQRVTRAFEVAPGASNVKVRYRFVTSEVPGGYFGSQYNDYFGVTVRSQTGGGRASESASMNGLGLGAFSAGGATGWRELSLPTSEAGDLIQIDALVANVGDGAYDSQLVVDFVEEGTLSITEVALRDRVPTRNGPVLHALEYLSLGAHPFHGGQTRVWGTVEVRGQPEDRLDDLILTATGGSGAVAAFGSLSQAARDALPTTFGDDGVIRLSMTEGDPLFVIPADAFFNAVTESPLRLDVYAYAASGEDAEKDAGSAYGLRYYDGANRFSRAADPRDTNVGGDSWAQPSLYAFTQAILADPASSDFLFNDFANMNGGLFPPHSGHQDGYEVDTATPRINTGTRDSTSARRIINFLNGPYGSGVRTIGVTYTSAIRTAVDTTTLADGRSARSVVRNWEYHTHHFHLNLKRSWAPTGNRLVTVAGDGQAWVDRGPRYARASTTAHAEAALRNAPVQAVVMPNPSVGRRVLVRVSAPAAMESDITVYDMMGRRVQAIAGARFAQGLTDVRLDMGSVAAGVYVVVVETAGGALSRTRFTILR